MGTKKPSWQGNGTLGHCALVVTPATYEIASNGIPFVAPINPGAAPIHPNGATNAVITKINRQLLANQKEFTTYMTTKACLKKLILTAVPTTYTDELKAKFIGFANITTLQILQHLITEFGRIIADDLDKNMTKLHKY
jgi:hypothetical protein